MNRARIKGTLGLARRAGRLLLGEDPVLDAIRQGTARIVFLASDAGPNTAKRMTDKTTFRGVPLVTALSGEELANAAGRPVLKVCGIVDAGFAALCAQALQEPEQS